MDWSIDTRVVNCGVGDYRVWDVNEGDANEGTWSKIAEFYYQHDAELFIEAKRAREANLKEARRVSMKKFGAVYKELADS